MIKITQSSFDFFQQLVSQNTEDSYLVLRLRKTEPAE